MPISIHQSTDKIIINNSPKINIWNTLLLLLLLGIWYFIEQLFFGIASNNLFITSNQLLAYLWLFFWTIAGLLTFFQLLWNIFGKEHLVDYKDGRTILEKQLFFLKKRVSINVQSIQINTKQIRRFPMSLQLGKITMATDEGEYRFGERLTSLEVEQVLTTLTAYSIVVKR